MPRRKKAEPEWTLTTSGKPSLENCVRALRAVMGRSTVLSPRQIEEIRRIEREEREREAEPPRAA